MISVFFCNLSSEVQFLQSTLESQSLFLEFLLGKFHGFQTDLFLDVYWGGWTRYQRGLTCVLFSEACLFSLLPPKVMGLDLLRTGAYRAIEWMTLRCWRNSGDLPEKMFVITAQKH